MPEYAICFALAFALSLLLTLVVRAGARRFGFVAKPRPDRWHRRPTALLGGVGMFLAFALTCGLRHPADLSGDALLLVCCAGMFVLGLVDDFVQLKPYAKLVVQILIATAFTTFGMRLHWFDASPVLDQAITIFWLVGITNAVNLLDNLDGLAGGIAAIAAAYLVYFCHVSGQASTAAMTAAFCGAIVGFLVFNFNPATIFMGDCGSLFLGFFLGGITMVGNQAGGLERRNIIAILAIPVLVLLIPILDTTLVTISRKFYGRPISQGGRDHTSHRLVALGLSERAAALTLWTVAGVSGGVAVLVREAEMSIALLVVPVFAIAVLFLLTFVGRVKVYEPVSQPSQVRGRALLPTLAEFAYKRRIFEVLNDLALILLAYYGSFLLRFDGVLVEPHYEAFRRSIPIVITVQLAAFLGLGLYQGLWRYTSLRDLRTLLVAVGGAWLGTVIALALVYRLEGFSRAALLMDGILLLLAVGGSRVSFRLIRDHFLRLKMQSGGKRVVIYGAGDGGELLVRELINNHGLGLMPVAFVDDDPNKHGRLIHGVRVVGSLEEVEALAQRQQVDEVLVSMQGLVDERAQLLQSMCKTRSLATRHMRIVFE